MTEQELTDACADACPHCAAGSKVRYRLETLEYVHDYSAAEQDVDTPALAAQGGPKRLMRGTWAHTYCAATPIRRAAMPVPPDPQGIAL